MPGGGVAAGSVKELGERRSSGAGGGDDAFVACRNSSSEAD